MTLTERLEKYFRENEAWHDDYDNWTVPGDRNPWPEKIYSAFLQYFHKNYVAKVSYKLQDGSDITCEADKDELYDATMHAWFDCYDIDSCIDTLETWLVDYYEQWLGEDLAGPVTVEFIKK